MIVQSAWILEEKRLEGDPIQVNLNWTDLELIVGEDTAIQMASGLVVQDFKNFIEPWEYKAIVTNGFANERKLTNKYKGICLYDADENNYYGRVVAVEWKPRELTIMDFPVF